MNSNEFDEFNAFNKEPHTGDLDQPNGWSKTFEDGKEKYEKEIENNKKVHQKDLEPNTLEETLPDEPEVLEETQPTEHVTASKVSAGKILLTLAAILLGLWGASQLAANQTQNVSKSSKSEASKTQVSDIDEGTVKNFEKTLNKALDHLSKKDSFKGFKAKGYNIAAGDTVIILAKKKNGICYYGGWSVDTGSYATAEDANLTEKCDKKEIKKIRKEIKNNDL